METTEQFYAKDRQSWRNWLLKNHHMSSAIWLVFDKGSSRTISYDAIVEEALCFGWIDSKPGKISNTQSKLYLSKRKPKSVWSKSNKERVLRLRKQGLMTRAGEDAIATAQSNGAWDALNASDSLTEPPGLTVALDEVSEARAFYDALSSSSKRILLEWIYAAKTNETRDRRISETVKLAAIGKRAR